jgi:hypothetical protein
VQLFPEESVPFALLDGGAVFGGTVLVDVGDEGTVFDDSEQFGLSATLLLGGTD